MCCRCARIECMFARPTEPHARINLPFLPPPQVATAGSRSPVPLAQPQQELTKTATIRNSVNLKKTTLRLVPLPGDAQKLLITFAFDNSAPCVCVIFHLLGATYASQ